MKTTKMLATVLSILMLMSVLGIPGYAVDVVERPAASACFDAETPTYEIGGQVAEKLSVGDVTAKTRVTNKHSKGLFVSMITAEYILSESGVKTLVQVKKDTKEIPAGETRDFENTVTVTTKEGHILQTMLMVDDALEPIGTAVSLLPGEKATAVYKKTETDENGIFISVYQISR